MTVTQLIRKLERLREKHGNCQVAVNCREMLAKFSDVFDIVSVETAEFEQVLQADGDGFGLTDSQGREKFQPNIVLC
jgi:hypothetical protein